MNASRVAIGYGNLLSVEVYGTQGTARFSTEMPSFYDMALFDGSNPANFVRYPNRPSSPAVGALTAVPHGLASVGYAEIFSFMIHEFLNAIETDTPFENGTIDNGYRAAQVLDAIQHASTHSASVKIDLDS